MSTVLVTGANGFVGWALCVRMLEEGWQVRGTVRSAKLSASLPTGVEAVQIEAIGPDTDWSKVLAGIDVVIHLAARVHVMKDTAIDPLSEFRQVNVDGTQRLAQMAAAAGVRRLVYVSSVKVNGSGSLLPYSETDTPAPKDPYDISKWEAEQVLHKIAADTELDVVILRPPVVYGPGVKANFLHLLKLVASGIPLPLDSVDNRRSLIYVGNLVDAIITCASHPRAAGETFLVSDDEDISTPQLIHMISAGMEKQSRLLPCPTGILVVLAKLIGKSSEIERLISSLSIDCSKIRTTLGWKPPFSMEEGIRETIDWFAKKV